MTKLMPLVLWLLHVRHTKARAPARVTLPYNITGSPCSGTASRDETWCSIWMMNTDMERSLYIEKDGELALVNVEAVTVGDVDFPETVSIYATGVPNYQVTATQTLIDSLNSRPRASEDFTGGTTTLEVGDRIDFGLDIGYNTGRCQHGFWPPGPVCPEDIQNLISFPTAPTAPAEIGNQCFFALGVIALFINGVSVFNWGDGQSYNGEDQWHNIAPVFEKYDVDICGGHAANEQYHHHSYTTCLQDELGDDGTAHSPIIAMVPDGNFHYGLYHDVGVEAQSCWKVRDYSDASDPLGCGGTGERTCVLVNNLDATAGTKLIDLPGPSVTEFVASLSGNSILAASGAYYEDYYFDPDCFAQGGEYLDEHNGHVDDDNGYHYHATSNFPYMVGPSTYFGEVTVDGWRCNGYSWDSAASATSTPTASPVDDTGPVDQPLTPTTPLVPEAPPPNDVSWTYELPVWWTTIESAFTGDDLKRCFKRQFAPTPGDVCATREKTCFFGDQVCDTGLEYPDTKCFCDGSQDNPGTWSCESADCPGGEP